MPSSLHAFPGTDSMARLGKPNLLEAVRGLNGAPALGAQEHRISRLETVSPGGCRIILQMGGWQEVVMETEGLKD